MGYQWNMEAVMEAFKEMLAKILKDANVMEHRPDVPYALQIEVKYLISVVEDIDKRMKRRIEGY